MLPKVPAITPLSHQISSQTYGELPGGGVPEMDRLAVLLMTQSIPTQK
jgi:hypothetical protein